MTLLDHARSVRPIAVAIALMCAAPFALADHGDEFCQTGNSVASVHEDNDVGNCAYTVAITTGQNYGTTSGAVAYSYENHGINGGLLAVTQKNHQMNGGLVVIALENDAQGYGPRDANTGLVAVAGKNRGVNFGLVGVAVENEEGGANGGLHAITLVNRGEHFGIFTSVAPVNEGNATGFVPITILGRGTTYGLVAATLTGDAQGLVAVSATGHASGWQCDETGLCVLAVSGCDGVDSIAGRVEQETVCLAEGPRSASVPLALLA